MPLTSFVCPDGETVACTECLSKCRMSSRCATVPTLRQIGSNREWKGIPSVTQLLKGTREAYLEIKHDYSASPDSFAFAFLGTRAHGKLDHDEANHLLEERLTSDEISGQFDLWDAETKTLYDYKTSGSYKVAKALGVVKVTTEVETGEVYKTGAKKGLPKTRKEYAFEKGEPDMADWIKQLNFYRLLLQGTGFLVDRMAIQAIVRDGGTFTAKSRGIDRNIYVIDVPRLPDAEVNEYFNAKRDALLFCLGAGVMPEACTEEERWDGKKCLDYCHVWHLCDVGIAAHQALLPATENDEESTA